MVFLLDGRVMIQLGRYVVGFSAPVNKILLEGGGCFYKFSIIRRGVIFV